jgi:hypothetical protein
MNFRGRLANPSLNIEDGNARLAWLWKAASTKHFYWQGI